jgi:hypothetical protein
MKATMVAMPSKRSRLGIHRRDDLTATSVAAASSTTFFA